MAAKHPWIWRAIILAVALAAFAPFLAWCWGAPAPDIQEFLVPWYRHIVSAGRWAVFGAPFGNYSPPYLYLLSLASLADGWAEIPTIVRSLSIALTGLLAAALALTLRRCGASMLRGFDGAGLLLLLPSVIINAVMLGQCDALWAAPCLMAVRAAIAGERTAMAAWCGVAFAVKAQAIFLAPFAVGVLLAQGRLDWRAWVAAPLAFLACLAPAFLAGWPALDLATIYFRQGQEYAGQLSLGAANLWLVWDYTGLGNHAWATKMAYGLGLLAAATCTWVTYRAARGGLAQADWLAVALLPALALPYVLPMMHERYFFLADILALALAFAVRDRLSIAVALAIQAGSCLALLAYITGESATFLHVRSGFGPLGTAATVATTLALGLTAFRVWRRVSARPARPVVSPTLACGALAAN